MSKIKACLFTLPLFITLLTACEEKDYCAYSATSCAEPDTSDMGSSQPDLKDGCVVDADCPTLDNTKAQCLATGACIYTCQDGWADPDGMIQDLGCTCDKSKSSCMELAVCGDGIKEGREECDDGVNNSDESPNTCRTSCKAPFCGDGVKDDGEDCDDGNNDNTDSCTTSCTACGNGVLDPGETCDDQQVPGLRGDGCSPTCQVETEWDFRCSETLPSTCWQEILPKEGWGDLSSTDVAVNEDHLFINWGGLSDGQATILVYKRNEFGAWVKSYEIVERNINTTTLNCSLFATEDELICYNDYGTSQLIYRKSNNVFVSSIEPKINILTPGQARVDRFYPTSNHILIRYYVDDSLKLRILKKNGLEWSVEKDLDIENGNLKNIYISDIDKNGDVIWTSEKCILPNSPLKPCFYTSNISNPEIIKQINHPNPEDSLNWSQGKIINSKLFTYDDKNIIHFENLNTTPKSSPYPRTLPFEEQIITLSKINNEVWLTQTQKNNPTVKKIDIKNGLLVEVETYSPPLPLNSIPYFTIRGYNSTHAFLTETYNAYNATGKIGVLYILPRKKE